MTVEPPPRHPSLRHWVLHGATMSIVLETRQSDDAPGRPSDAAPVWRYWGPRLADGAVPPLALHDGDRLPTFHPDRPVPLTIAPVHGSGWFGAPAVLAHRDGRSCAQDWTDCRIERDDARNALTIDLVDAPSALQLTLTLSLDPASDVLTMQSVLTNTGDALLDVQWLAAGTMALPPHSHAVTSWHGRHNSEFVESAEPLGRSGWRRENRRGLTSHEVMPSALVHADDGVVYAGHLAWSGNSVNAIERCADGQCLWQMGEWLVPGEVRLTPGQSLTSPEWLLSCSAAGRNGVMQHFHRYMRALVDWPMGQMQPRPVHINSWEGFYFDHDETRLKQLADQAAALGIERFVLDDGWFHGRADDRRALGDWYADAGKYPAGLGPLADHVIARGMAFGLWVEPEMVNAHSELFRAHPDWALQQTGRTPPTARHQLVLNMARTEVADHLFERLSALLETLPITYLKWDHNRVLMQAGDAPAYRQQILASYALMARLRAQFPHVEIEACAGGGGRIDAGVLRHCHRFWTSDCIDAVSRVAMQRGFLQFFPPELMGAHIGSAPAHSTGRRQSMDFRCAVALPGHFGVELNPATLDSADAACLGGWIARYKGLRDRLHSGAVWLGTGHDGIVWQAHGDAAHMLLIVTRVEPATLAHEASIRLPMLDAGSHYDVQRVDPRAGDNPAVRYAGSWLAQAGLPLAPMRAETVRLFELVQA